MNSVIDFLKEMLVYIIIIVIVILIKKFIFTPIKVNGPSMNDTFHDGDIMILDEISYRFKDIKRFDIVVIKYQDEFIIKRVIALPGETVEFHNNKLYINGEYVKEDFNYKKTLDFDKVRVPKDCYFVLGDNRVNSVDSRMIGPVKKSDIRGHARLTLFPFNRFGNKK